MLTINGFKKITNESFSIKVGSTIIDYVIKRIDEHQNFYDFIIFNRNNGHTSVVGLHRHSKSEFRGEKTYDLLWNGIDSRVSVTAGYIEDKNEMIKSIMSVLENSF